MAQYNLRGNRTLALDKVDGAKQPPKKMTADEEESISLQSVMLAIRESKEDLSKHIGLPVSKLLSQILKSHFQF